MLHGCAPGVMPALNSVTTPAGRDPSDPIAGGLGEPQIAVRTGRDVARARPGRDARAELGHDAGRRDLADAVAVELGEPQIAVGPGRDAVRGAPPAVMPALNSVTTPAVVICPIRLAVCSVNHRLPSGPAAMLLRPALAVMPALNSVTVPAVVIRPIRLPPFSRTRGCHRDRRRWIRERSLGCGRAELGDRATVPLAGIAMIRPIRLPVRSTNQTLLSGPALFRRDWRRDSGPR